MLSPEEGFYLVAENETILEELIGRTAKIGYEKFIEAAFVFGQGEEITSQLELSELTENLAAYTMVDVRNAAEAKEYPVFEKLSISLCRISGNDYRKYPLINPF